MPMTLTIRCITLLPDIRHCSSIGRQRVPAYDDGFITIPGLVSHFLMLRLNCSRRIRLPSENTRIIILPHHSGMFLTGIHFLNLLVIDSMDSILRRNDVL